MTPTPHGQVPKALRIADEFKLCSEYDSKPSIIDIEKAEAELRRLHAENVTLQQGYDAARLEIDSLQARVQELGAMLRTNCNRRIVELEAQLEAIGAGGVEPLRRDHFRDATEMVPVGWAISYDGKNPHALWTEGEGDLLDLEVKRQGGTACKMQLYARAEK